MDESNQLQCREKYDTNTMIREVDWISELDLEMVFRFLSQWDFLDWIDMIGLTPHR